MTAITPAAAAAGWLAAPPLHHPSAQRYEQHNHHQHHMLPSFPSSSTISYHTSAPNIYPIDPVQQRTSFSATTDTAGPPPQQKRRRLSKYANAEAQQAAKLLQNAKRREQNRIAQRRLRDRKEEHIFKLEGEVAVLRRQSEGYRCEAEGLEELVRRLVAERDVLLRRFDVVESSDGRTARPVLGINALGLIDVDQVTPNYAASRSSSMSGQSTSASLSTPKTPSALFHSPRPIASKTSFIPRRNASPTCQLPRVKFDPTPTPPLSGAQWNHAH